MSYSPRTLHSVYGEQTKRRFESFNAKAEALSYERSDIESARHKIMEDAYTRRDTVPRLRFRSDTIRDRTLQCDLDELALFEELAELEKLAQNAWLCEVERLRAAQDNHLRALISVADEMELDSRSEERTHLVDYDPMLVSIRRAIEHAERMAAAQLIGKDDRLSAEKVQASIAWILS